MAKIRGKWNSTCWILVLAVGISFVLHTVGIRQNLPYTPEVDEPIFVRAAINITSSGDWNPHWFGNPGSTVIYPLAVLFRVWFAATHRGMFFHPDPNLRVAFEANPNEFYLLGRLLTIIYAVISVPLVYRLGKEVFGRRVGLIGAWLFVLSPLAVAHARLVRTDSAATFYGLLSLWLGMKLYDRPRMAWHIVTGLAIGLAVATRYFMIALAVVLLAMDSLIFWKHRFSKSSQGPLLLSICAGFAAIVFGFAISTPYFFLDFGTAMQSLKVEARSTHLGADGLSPMGNLWFYISQAMPSAMTWPNVLLAAVGLLSTLWKPRPKRILLVGFVGIFLGGISLSPLHWHRWIIPIIPVLVLFAAHALDRIAAFLSFPILSGRAALAGLVLLASAWPLGRTALIGIQGLNPTTRVLAREWILANIPPGSRIAQEAYAAPLGGTDYIVFEQFSLATGRTLEDYYREGYRYLVLSSAVYRRYLAEPDRCKTEVEFYQALFARAKLLQEFRPSNLRGGPVVRIYELGE
ncbi:MAG: glycosyltransferase family 39 protein [Anaerolineae bacterium]|nr:glycosyltransferase family 39 protein [Anaerolineae bacterium]